jgi:hypothetical protein
VYDSGAPVWANTRNGLRRGAETLMLILFVATLMGAATFSGKGRLHGADQKETTAREA